jgi:hypothetical protein
MTMAAVMLSDHCPAGDVERGEQAGSAMTDVVMSHPRRRRRHQRQDRGRAVDRLHLRFFVHRKHQRVLRRGHVQADHIADFVHELRISRQFPRLDRVRLQPERPPDPRHRRLRHTCRRGHRPGRPVRVLPGSLLQGLRDHLLDLSIGDYPRPTRPRLVRQALQPAGQEPRSPLRHHVPRHTQVRGHLPDRAAFATQSATAPPVPAPSSDDDSTPPKPAARHQTTALAQPSGSAYRTLPTNAELTTQHTSLQSHTGLTASDSCPLPTLLAGEWTRHWVIVTATSMYR